MNPATVSNGLASADAASDAVDVAIAGLGPTGLILAHALGQRGVRVLVLEREPRFYGNARAVYTDGECMRIYQSFGMADRLAADMLQDAVANLVLPNGKLLFQLRNARRTYGWPTHNFIYQPLFESALAEGLARYPNVTVLRGRELVRLEQDANEVRVWHAESQGSGYGKCATDPHDTPRMQTRLRARYLVGADGGRSTVRALVGIDMVGKNFPNPWLVVDIKAKDPRDGLHHLPNFNFICDPACPTVSCIQPHGHHRFEFMLMPGQTRESMEHPDTVRQYLSRHIDVDKFEILRTLVYTFNALMAQRWREGRVLLAGDAAHMTPQFIGQGMNAGVRDAFNLAWKLDAVLAERASDALLDSYERERRPHAAAMTREGIRMKDYVSMVNPIGHVARNLLTKIVLATPWLGDFVTRGDFIPKPTYRTGSYMGLARTWRNRAAGRQMPQPLVRGPLGRAQLLDELTDNAPLLIGMGIDPRTQLTPNELMTWTALDTRFIAAYAHGRRPEGAATEQATPEGLVEIEDLDGLLLDWLRANGARRGHVAIVRPDRVVFGLVPGRELGNATRAFTQQLHMKTPGDAIHQSGSPGSGRNTLIENNT